MYGKQHGDPAKTWDIENWDEARGRVRELLRMVASGEARTRMRGGSGLISYGEISERIPEVGAPHGRGLATILGEISRTEFREGRPPLSAVACYQEGDSAGPGFFSMGRTSGMTNPGETELEFWVRRVGECHEYWKVNARA